MSARVSVMGESSASFAKIGLSVETSAFFLVWSVRVCGCAVVGREERRRVVRVMNGEMAFCTGSH